jgi:hypothetical protein
MLHLGASYPIYDVAYWLSVMSPFHSAPSQAMGQQLTEGFHMTGGTSIPLREAALARMEDGWRKAPCLMSYANDALILLRGEKMTPEVQAHSERILARSLACNARHGLSYYHAGLFALKQGKENVALQWWNAGLRASRVTGDHLLLTAAILSRMYPSHRLVLGELSIRMAEALERLEADPSKMADQAFWSHAQHLLWSIAGRKYLELMAAAA